jgi:hypothetical protein
MDVSAPKSRASARQVAIPAFLRPVLISRVVGKQVDDLVFPAPGGGYLRNGNWRNRSGWRAAVTELGLTDVTPHDLRRTFGSLARSAGADLAGSRRRWGTSRSPPPRGSTPTCTTTSSTRWRRLSTACGVTDERGTVGAREHALCPKCAHDRGLDHEGSPGRVGRCGADLGFCLEPPGGIEPTTYPLRARFGGSSTGGPPALTCFRTHTNKLTRLLQVERGHHGGTVTRGSTLHQLAWPSDHATRDQAARHSNPR